MKIVRSLGGLGGGTMFSQNDKPGPTSKTPSLGGPPMSGVSAVSVDAPSVPTAPSSIGVPSSLAPAPGPTSLPNQSPGAPSIPEPHKNNAPVPVGPAQKIIAGDDSLLAIKQQALTQLTPLVDKLDQTPEEHFQLIMTMIQSSDNQVMVKAAFDSAQKITNEKARAEALLAVINEVNYFSQKDAEPVDKSGPKSI